VASGEVPIRCLRATLGVLGEMPGSRNATPKAVTAFASRVTIKKTTACLGAARPAALPWRSHSR